MIELNSTNNLESAFLGQIEYKKAENLQNDLLLLAQNKNQFSIVGLEHPAVLTLGHRAEIDSSMLCNIPVVKSSRGGLMTIHSEGQLVIYPILNLRQLGLGVKDYVYLLLQTTQNLLEQISVTSYIDEQAIGLYTVHGKICFCGIKVKNGITQHGISLNVRNDLSLFQNIISCGVQNPKLDRLQNYGVNQTLEELFNIWNSVFLEKIR